MSAVDVRIPVMGRATYLAGAIEAVLRQSFQDWSLVVSENGIPDPAIASTVLPYLSDDRVQHLRVGADLSAAAHHTRLVRSGEAPYVTVLHDDDRWHTDFLRDHVRLLEREPGAAFAFSGARVVDDGGRELATAVPALPDGVQEPSSFVPWLYGGNLIHVSATVLRRSALEAVDGSFLDEFPTFDDHELWFRLAVRFPAGYLKRCDVDIRRHQAQLSAERPVHGEERLHLLDRFDALLSESLPGAVGSARREAVRSEALLSCALDAAEAGETPRARTLVRRAFRERPLSLAGARGIAAALGAAGGPPGRYLAGALRRRGEQRRPFR